ncbi:hypothetical protein CXF85_00850 [Colwellia sp. 75C3]|uniref:hypothetical protein n=1 Tax=Colwellia sp. 75C3 TaxID=888425 RepID=UPI000C334F35|nr:hypothetical protein [Colwellia sp. 75C3]PKG86290.1 hypothetical protein CXF85_00850 [Colwellia sp. 75C3]
MNLLEILNEETTLSRKEDFPNWISNSNSSLKVFHKIKELNLEKLSYIKKHGKVNDYRKKGNYQITQVEVASAVEMARTGLFTHGSYAKELKAYLDSVNDDLEKRKVERVKKVGLRANDKETVVKKAQSLQQNYDELKNKKLSEFYDDVAKKMPLKDKQKLGLF